MVPDPDSSKTSEHRFVGRYLTICALGVYIVSALAFLLLGGGGSVEAGPNLHDIQFQTLDGQPSGFDRYQSQPLVVNFFASTCAPCIAEMPDFESVHQSHGNRVAFVGLAVNDGVRQARGIVDETGVTYDIGLEPGDDLIIELGGYGLPTTVFVSGDGEVLETHTGALTSADLVEKLENHFDL